MEWFLNSNLAEVNDMDTERMIRELRRVADKHVDDKLMTLIQNVNLNMSK